MPVNVGEKFQLKPVSQAEAFENKELLNLQNDNPTGSNKIPTRYIKQVADIKELLKELLNLQNDSPTGPDKIPTRYIKQVADIIAAPLTYIINTCIQSNIFPEAWKTSRISPIPKTEAFKNNDDFRPIAILPVLSKIYERLVLKQQLSFIDNCINDNMSGFRKGHSTATILMSMRDDIMRAMKKGELTLMLLVDFSKPFDTLNFKTVLKCIYENYHFLLKKLAVTRESEYERRM